LTLPDNGAVLRGTASFPGNAHPDIAIVALIRAMPPLLSRIERVRLDAGKSCSVYPYDGASLRVPSPPSVPMYHRAIVILLSVFSRF
jgi:hypothetical protein